MLLGLAIAVVGIVFGILLLIFSPNVRELVKSLYFVLALFWLVVGVVTQVYWTDLRLHMFVPVSREMLGVIFFILFSYNFVRCRMARMMRRTDDDTTEPPRPRVIHREYDPTFDFSKPEAEPKDTGIMDKERREGIVDRDKKAEERKDPPGV